MLRFIYILLYFSISFLLVNAYSQSDLDNAALKWYILSDSFSSQSSCDAIRIENNSNPDYSGRVRTVCFDVWNSFYYLIWAEWVTTDLAIIFRSSWSSSSNWEASYDDLYNDLTNESKISDMSISDLTKMKEDILSNPNLTDAEKALLLALINKEVYKKLEENLLNSDYIWKLSVDDLDKLKNWVLNNPNLSQAEKDRLLSLIDNELNKRSWFNVNWYDIVLEKIWINPNTTQAYTDLKSAIDNWKLDLLSSAELELLKEWVILNDNLTWEEKAELLALIEGKINAKEWLTVLEKMWVSLSSPNLYNDIIVKIDSWKLNNLSTRELDDLKDEILINNNLSWEDRASILSKIESFEENNWIDDSISDIINSVWSAWSNNNTSTTSWSNNNINTNKDSDNDGVLDIYDKCYTAANERYNVYPKWHIKAWCTKEVVVDNTTADDDTSDDNTTVNNDTTVDDNINWSYIDLFKKYSINTWSWKLFLELIKLIESWNLSSWEEDLLKKFINETSLLNSNQKTHLISLFVHCNSSQKKALKFEWNVQKAICIDKNIRTCIVKNRHYVPFSMWWGIMKFYDDRFFEERTGLYYWKCLDDSRFQKLKPLVCLNWYNKYWNKCEKEATVDYKKEKCKTQCNTTYLWQKLYYSNSWDDFCECMYYRNWNSSLAPSYVTSEIWNEKYRLWLSPKKQSSSYQSSNNSYILPTNTNSSNAWDNLSNNNSYIDWGEDSLSDFLNNLFD